MTTLELKQVRTRNGHCFDYKEHLAGIVRSVPPLDAQGVQKRGFASTDMDEAEALAAKIEAANGMLELTSAEVMQIASKVELHLWPWSDPAFSEFVKDVIALRDA
jgi:hypothetical protein